MSHNPFHTLRCAKCPTPEACVLVCKAEKREDGVPAVSGQPVTHS